MVVYIYGKWRTCVMSVELTEHGEGDVALEGGRVVPRPAWVAPGVGRAHLLRVDRLIGTLRVQDEAALATWPRVRSAVFVPVTNTNDNCNLRRSP